MFPSGWPTIYVFEINGFSTARSYLFSLFIFVCKTQSAIATRQNVCLRNRTLSTYLGSTRYVLEWKDIHIQMCTVQRSSGGDQLSHIDKPFNESITLLFISLNKSSAVFTQAKRSSHTFRAFILSLWPLTVNRSCAKKAVSQYLLWDVLFFFFSCYFKRY